MIIFHHFDTHTSTVFCIHVHVRVYRWTTSCPSQCTHKCCTLSLPLPPLPPTPVRGTRLMSLQVTSFASLHHIKHALHRYIILYMHGCVPLFCISHLQSPSHLQRPASFLGRKMTSPMSSTSSTYVLCMKDVLTHRVY